MNPCYTRVTNGFEREKEAQKQVLQTKTAGRLTPRLPP